MKIDTWPGLARVVNGPLWFTFVEGEILPTIWLCLGGHKPLAHLPRWKRLLRPAIRWRLL